ncbi:MAG: CoA-binding protein, partial [Desulfosalsimonas sp.]
MEKFFRPGSVAVVGAGGNNLGGFVVKNLLSGFDGEIYPVNPNYDEIDGIPCFPSIDSIPDAPDLAVVLVPARAVPSVLKACAEKGVKRVIIESAGFSETGDEGILLQEKCTAIAKKAGIRLWGPNCMGIVDVRRKYVFSFMNPEVREELLEGDISLIVQSGMMSAIFLAELGRRGIGVAKACSIGNRADVDECDII